MKPRLTIAYIGNLIDIVSTLYFTSIGFVEINPIMAWLLQWPILFIAVKILVMTFYVILLWYARHEMMAVIASWFASLLYGVLQFTMFGFLCKCFVDKTEQKENLL